MTTIEILESMGIKWKVNKRRKYPRLLTSSDAWEIELPPDDINGHLAIQLVFGVLKYEKEREEQRQGVLAQFIQSQGWKWTTVNRSKRVKVLRTQQSITIELPRNFMSYELAILSRLKALAATLTGKTPEIVNDKAIENSAAA